MHVFMNIFCFQGAREEQHPHQF